MNDKDVIILLHGLSGMPKTMVKFEEIFKKNGFTVHNIGYLARFKNLDQTGDGVANKILNLVPSGKRLHFVCHSMGGLVCRYVVDYVTTQYEVGSVVTIGTPHKGATWVDKIPGGQFIGEKFFGKDIVRSLQDYAGIDSLNDLSSYNCLCITGNRRFTWKNPLSWYVGKFLGDSDGFVPVEGTVLPTANVLEIDDDHLTILFNQRVINEAFLFITQGVTHD